ncbi:hypothetical protein [Selenomonas sp. KH1T6]|uniref:hypothetical protein n=1 Tax=Selenomonas sp. KH1T6 TaxID=3158784 RepID=UPI0008A802BA|nr:hypothetical protein SAMN05216583_10373 [Selenomonas ruminantium]
MYLDEAYPDYYIFGSTILLNGKKHYLTSVSRPPTMNLYSPKAWSSRWTRPPRQLESTDITALLQILGQGDFYCKPYTGLSHYMRPAWCLLQMGDIINLINNTSGTISDLQITCPGFNTVAAFPRSHDALTGLL